MSWLSDIQAFVNEDTDWRSEPATRGQISLMHRLMSIPEASPYVADLDAAAFNRWLTAGEASELIQAVVDDLREQEVREGYPIIKEQCSFLNFGTNQKDIIDRVTYLVDLKNT